jgi:hypothetical protein
MRDENRQFGIVMAAGFLLVGVIRYILTGMITWWLGAVGLVWLLVAFTWPRILAPVRLVWMKLGHVLGFVNGRIILTVLFLGIITPVALVMRLFRKQPIGNRLSADADSYWHPRSREEFVPQRMERQF